MDLALDHVWLPAVQPSKKLMVVLHGLGDSTEGFLWLQDALSIDSLDYLLLNAPTPYYTGFSWYNLPPNQAPGIANSRKVLTEVFTQVEGQGYPADRTLLRRFARLSAISSTAATRSRTTGSTALARRVFKPSAPTTN